MKDGIDYDDYISYVNSLLLAMMLDDDYYSFLLKKGA